MDHREVVHGFIAWPGIAFLRPAVGLANSPPHLRRALRSGTGVIEFHDCLIREFGYPNDEALGGHPLYERGLRFYGVYEAECTSGTEPIGDERPCQIRHFVPHVVTLASV